MCGGLRYNRSPSVRDLASRDAVHMYPPVRFLVSQSNVRHSALDTLHQTLCVEHSALDTLRQTLCVRHSA